VSSTKAFSRLDDKSRMSREAHVRFCEGGGVKFPSATRPPSEALFKTLKTELMQGRKAFTSRQSARAEIFEYIEVFYNRQRLHSSLGNVTPVEFEKALEEGCPDITQPEKVRLRPATEVVSEESIA
jgi:hypothetical protein